MSDNIKDMIRASRSKKVLDFNRSFESEIKQKLFDKFAERKIEMQKNLFVDKDE